MTPDTLTKLLNDNLRQSLAGTLAGDGVSGLTRLSGGANNETWKLAWGDTPLILRRRPFSADSIDSLEGNILGLSLVDEASVIQLASATAVPVPAIHAVFDSDHPIGEAFLMGFIPGESIPQRWLTDAAFEEGRGKLAFQCGEALARIHAIDPRQAPCVLLHGDFRTGNLLVNEQGLAGVLDWELTHQGPAEEDLGYLCANVWRFGHLDKPVGGFGDYDDLIAGYQSASGWSPELSTIRYWEIFAALSWGLVCQTMGALWHSGNGDVERAAVARRRSEAELDILLLIEEWENA
jgi:aminoglycoside phosphotransferase (APT) family kinase protein